MSTTPTSEKLPDILSPGRQHLAITENDADVTLRLVEAHGDDFPPMSEERQKKLQWKLYLRIMGLLSLINIMLFVSRFAKSLESLLNLILS